MRTDHLTVYAWEAPDGRMRLCCCGGRLQASLYMGVPFDDLGAPSTLVESETARARAGEVLQETTPGSHVYTSVRPVVRPLEIA